MPELLDDPTLAQVEAQIGAAEADEAKLIVPGSDVPATADTATTTTGDRGPGTESTEVQTPESKPETGTAADKEPQNPTEQKTAPKETKYAKAVKDKERQDRSWNALNVEKEQLAKERESFKAQQEAHAKERADFEAQRQAASKPKYTPEQVDAKATEWLKAAETLEAQGDFKGADKARFKAEELQDFAKQLRANPPPGAQTPEQKAAADKATADQLQKAQAPWWDKASKEFPDAVKKGSDLHKALNALIQPPGREGNDPTKYDKILSNIALTTPEGMYYVTRLAHAETLAAKVPGMEKTAGELRAKVKELAGKLAIPMEGVTTTHDTKQFGQMTESEQEASIRGELAGQEASYV